MFQETGGLITSVALAQDDDLLVSGCEDGSVTVWSMMARKRVHTMIGHQDRVTSVEFTSDSRQVVSGSYDTTIAVWDVENGALVRMLNGHKDVVTSLTVSSRGHLLSSSDDCSIKIWNIDFRTDAVANSIINSVEEPTATSVIGDLTLFAAGFVNGAIKIYGVVGHANRHWNAHEDAVSKLLVSPDQRILASASFDGSICLWDLATGDRLAELKLHENVVTDIAFSSCGSKLASGSDDKRIVIWDLENHSPDVVLNGHLRGVSSVAFTEDDRTLISGGSDKLLKFWDVATGIEKNSRYAHEHPVTAVAVHRNHVLTGSADGRIKAWDIESAFHVFELFAHQGRITELHAIRGTDTLISASSDQEIRVWDLSVPKLRHILPGHTGAVSSVSSSRLGTHAVSTSTDRTIRLWNLQRGELLTKQIELRHSSAITTVSASPDENTVLSSSVDELKVWNPIDGSVKKAYAYPAHKSCIAGDRVVLSDGKLIRVGDPNKSTILFQLFHDDEVTSLGISGDGTRSVSGSEDRTIRVWDLENGRECGCLTEHFDTVVDVDITACGDFVASVSLDGSARVWDVENKKEVCSYTIEHDQLSAVALSKTAGLIACGTRSGVVLFIDMVSGELRSSFQAHEGAIVSAAFVRGSDTFVTASVDQAIKAWSIVDSSFLDEFEAEWPITSLSCAPSRVVAGDAGGIIHSICLRQQSDVEHQL